MLRHRVYHLTSHVSLLGLGLSDWLVILVSWLVGKQGFTGLLGERRSLLTAALLTLVIFRLWQRVKDRVPDKYAAHVMTWLVEADSYHAGSDTRMTPLIVNPSTPSKKELPGGHAI